MYSYSKTLQGEL